VKQIIKFLICGGEQMFIILVYDIQLDDRKGQRRLNRIMKLCRCFLHHTQKSVFEGEISESSLREMEFRIKEIIDEKKDFVVIYRIDNINNLERKNIGIDFDPNQTII